MAKSKNNNMLYIGIVAVVVIIAIIVGVVLANRGSGNEGGDTGAGEETSQTESLKASDLASVDEVIEYGDYDAMYDLSKSIQNGEMVGKVVKIEGDVSHPMSTYSVVQRNAADSSSIGTQFIIEGDTGYPEDGDRIVITGKVVENSTLYYVIKTLPEYVEIVDIEEE